MEQGVTEAPLRGFGARALSLAFEGLYGAGKSTVIHRLTETINISNHRVWLGDGFNYSLNRSRGFSIVEWTRYRLTACRTIEALCDFMFQERSALADFQKLGFRRQLVAPDELWDMNRAWLPDHIIVINTPVDLCAARIRARGDVSRADLHDLSAFAETLADAIVYLKPLLADRLQVVNDDEEAFLVASSLVRERLETLRIPA